MEHTACVAMGYIDAMHVMQPTTYNRHHLLCEA